MNETPTRGEQVAAATLYICIAILAIQLVVRPLLALVL